MGNYKGCVLVTGGSGFIGAHVVKVILEGGYQVHATTRSLSSQSAKVLKQLKIQNQEALKLFEADLLVDGSFNESMRGVEAVIHVATPVMFDIEPEKEEDQIKPALDGTKNVLNSCLDYDSIKTIVVTSSTSTIRDYTQDSQYIFSEKDPHPNLKDVTAYTKAKVLAEQFTWQFQEEHKDRFRVITVHPSFVLGPEMIVESDQFDINATTNVGKDIVIKISNATFEDDFEGYLNLVDVRDVASAHLLALESNNATGRFIIHADTVPLRHLHSHIASTFPQKFQPPSTHFKNQPQLKPAYYDTTKSKQVLKMTYREVTETLNDLMNQFNSSK